RHQQHRRHRRRSNQSNQSLKDDEKSNETTTKLRRQKLLQSKQTSQSFSLENIYFEGLLSEGICDPEQKRQYSRKRRILSFEDLPAIKKELSESSQEGEFSGSGGYSMIESEQYRHYTTKSTSKKPTRKTKLKNLPSTSTAMIDHPSIERLSKNEIINLWNSSEKQLLNRLTVTIQKNHILEEKLQLLQQMLKKPP
uniref:Uncharacterized protein LOC113795036 n=1 Tax=Dermatophagoides pteronyssinus TaxID=6956 RepID=A0A6P6Y7P3_DERPT